MRFFSKRKQTFKPFKQVSMKQNASTMLEHASINEEANVTEQIETKVEEKNDVNENNVDVNASNKPKRKKKRNMDTKEKLEMAQQILNRTNDANDFQFKRIKKDKGLIERTESSKTIITEDNKELLVD